MKIVINGCTGSIGNDLIDLALSQGHEVLAILNPNSKRNKNILTKPIKYIFASLDEYNKIDYTSLGNWDIFYHLAWTYTTGEERNNYHLQFANIHYSIFACQLAKNLNCKVFVGIGSQAEYAETKEILTENTLITTPKNIYGMAKAATCQQLKDYTLGMNFLWVRIGSVYGKNDKAGIVKYVLENENFILNSSGKQLWDFLYSKDCAEALLLLGIKFNYYGNIYEDYLLGYGESKTILNFLSEINKIPILTKEKDGPYLRMDCSKIQNELQWKPKYSFKMGVKDIYGRIYS